jgi:hypothetical protein
MTRRRTFSPMSDCLRRKPAGGVICLGVILVSGAKHRGHLAVGDRRASFEFGLAKIGVVWPADGHARASARA